MKSLLYIMILVFAGLTADAQTQKLTNKQKLTQMDSIYRIMQQKKNALAGLLDEFYRYSRDLEKQKDTSIKGNTITERLSSIDKNMKSRRAGQKTIVNASRSSLEKTVIKIKQTLDELTALQSKWSDKKDSMSEMNEMDMLMLQQMMDKKNQLESMISNVMKAGYVGGQAAVQALKAS